MEERAFGAAGGKAAALVTVLSASGGVGKSAVSLMAAYLAARAGLHTVLLEADMQFGDLGFWLGLDDELSTLAMGCNTQPIEVAERLQLYKAPCFPEVAEEVSDEVAALVPMIRRSCDLVIADTGAFWSGLTADLAVASDAVCLLADQRPSSIAGAVRASELCRRMGIPDVRRVCVYNRWSSKARVGADELRKALNAASVQCVPDGKGVVDELLCTGDLQELVETENPFACGVDELLAFALPRIGCPYERVGQARRQGWFK